MSKWMSAVLVAVLLPAGLASANLLVGGDFSSPDNEGWAQSGWVSWGGPGGRPLWADRAGTGRGAAAYGWAEASELGLYQDVPASAGLTYTFSIWVKKEPNYHEHSTLLKLEWVDAQHNLLGDAEVTNITGQAGETFAKFSVSGRTLNPACAYVRVVAFTRWNTPTAWNGLVLMFDDASLVPQSGALIEISGMHAMDVRSHLGLLVPWRLRASK